MSGTSRWAPSMLPALLALAALPAAAERKEFKYSAAAGTTVSVINDQGSVAVKAAPGRQVIIAATTQSAKVGVDASQSGNRIVARRQSPPGGAQGAEGRVDYEVQVPPGVHVNVRAGSGPVTVEGVKGDVTVESEKAQVDIRAVRDGHVHVRNMGGNTSLSNIVNGHAEVTTVTGEVRLQEVTGPQLSVNSGRGNIYYDGDFGGGGQYSLTSNTGSIQVTLPGTASVDIMAHSVRGSVQNEFPFQKKEQAPYTLRKGSSFVGTSNAGSSSVELRSFSGRIHVKQR